MGQYNFTTKLKSANFTVEIDDAAKYGYFEDCGSNDDDECAGGLWFSGGSTGGLWFTPSGNGKTKLALSDYDGVFELPAEVVTALADAGYDVSYVTDADKDDDTPVVTVKYHIGDLNNGHLQAFDTHEDAYKAYEEMAESCATTERGDEPDISREQAIAESRAFHYVCRVTTTKCGSVTSEKEEVTDGGDAAFNDTP